jgi:hypothetical protein
MIVMRMRQDDVIQRGSRLQAIGGEINGHPVCGTSVRPAVDENGFAGRAVTARGRLNQEASPWPTSMKLTRSRAAQPWDRALPEGRTRSPTARATNSRRNVTRGMEPSWPCGTAPLSPASDCKSTQIAAATGWLRRSIGLAGFRRSFPQHQGHFANAPATRTFRSGEAHRV